MKTRRPILLCIAGFDPTGGAGLQADVETAAALGVRAVCAQTCNTVQDGAGAKAVMPTATAALARQIECLTADFDVAAVKAGLIASADNAGVIAEAVAAIRRPLVTDPVLCDGTGRPLCGDGAARAIREQLLPLTACATPNREELAALAPAAATPADAAQVLLNEGCGAVFVTGEKQQEQTLHHALYLPDGGREAFFSPQLPGEFHGSGCTLSCALAAHLALGRTLREAVALALSFTAHALANAETPGLSGERRFPKRL